MKRRTFISMLVGGAGALVLPAWRKPEPVLFLPPRDFSTATMRVNNYFTSPHAWYIQMPVPDGLKLYDRRGHDDPFYASDGVSLRAIEHPYSNRLLNQDEISELTEAAVEEIAIELNQLRDPRGLKLVIPRTRRGPWHV
jgi:hypothetical protein